MLMIQEGRIAGMRPFIFSKRQREFEKYFPLRFLSSACPNQSRFFLVAPRLALGLGKGGVRFSFEDQAVIPEA